MLTLVGLTVTTSLAASVTLTALTGVNLGKAWHLFIFAWANYGIILFGTVLAIQILLMAKSGERNPRDAILKRLRAMRTPAILYFLAGLAQVAFGQMKPQIVMLTGFQFDLQLSALDRAILGNDAWRVLWPLMPLRPVLDYIYSLWYPALVMSLVLVMIRQPSQDRDRAILAYFLLWCVFAPIGQALVPAAGPIFYERIGLGGRFAPLIAAVPWGSLNASNHLWAAYNGSGNNFAAGISAMPSMHVAMAYWIAIAFWRSAMWPISTIYFIAVFLGSVLLGWHYLVDGIAGVAGAIGCWQVAKHTLIRFDQRNSEVSANPQLQNLY